MEEKPFFAWSFIDVCGTIMAKEKNPDCEESNVSLELSLSLDNTSTDKGKQKIHYKKLERTMNLTEKSSGAFLSEPSDADAEISLELSLSVANTSTETTTTDKGKQAIHYKESNDEYRRKLDVRNMMCMEKSSGALSSEPTESDTDADISLELSLSVNGTFTSKKRQTTENPKLTTNRNKRIKVETETVSTELRLAHDPWCIKKKLFKSDLGNMSRLILASDSVKAHVLRYWNADQLAKIEEGLPVLVWDCDTNSEHEMKFKRWNNRANVLIKNWVSDFVKRRELKQDDEIGLYWDIASSRFNFSVLNRAPML